MARGIDGIVFVVAICCCFASCSGQVANHKATESEVDSEKVYRNALEEGDRLYFSNKIQEAKGSYLKALEFAKKDGNATDQMFPRVKLSQILRREKEYESAEKLILESIQVCKQESECLEIGMELALNEMRSLYIFDLKDEAKMNELIRTSKGLEQYLGREKTQTILCEYIEDIKEGGFPNLAIKLRDQNDCERIR